MILDMQTEAFADGFTVMPEWMFTPSPQLGLVPGNSPVIRETKQIKGQADTTVRITGRVDDV